MTAFGLIHPTMLPQAATLQIQLLHDRGDFDDAAELARAHIARFPEDAGLAAAVSVLALDVEDVDLARACAETAGAHPDALTTLGILELGDDDPETAEALFARALAINPHGARSWIGRGLARLGQGQAEDAASDIDHGAALFDDHIGSWIAAGWAHLVAGNLPAAKSRFERANEIDRSFAETIGSLAVIDILEGRIDEARHKTEAAFKLDRATFSAALAQTLLLAGDGKPEAAQAIFERALSTPVDASGRTIAQSLARMGLG